MRELTMTGKVKIYPFAELPKKLQQLLRLAQKARVKAQAPYSHFFVGAAVRSQKTGKVYAGCNVERCSYTQTTHAEQGAVDAMVAAEGAGAGIAAIAIVGGPESADAKLIDEFGKGRAAYSAKELPAPSCGHCLQIIWENCRGDRDVLLATMLSKSDVLVAPIGVCLPMAFGPDDLGVKYD